MLLVSSLAVISMFSSVFISDRAQTDALAINVAGSLRMQSYRLISQMQIEREMEGEPDKTKKLINGLVDEFEQDLTTGVLVNQQVLIQSKELATLYHDVQNDWFKEIKPVFIKVLLKEDVDLARLNQSIESFVNKIDTLVLSYQKHAEKNIAKIRLIQTLALFSTIILIAVAIVIVKRHIEQPLSKLIAIAGQIGRGDFTTRADETGKGELAVLAHAINSMSDSIYRSQSQLEEHVIRKTKKLSRSNESLNLLFQVSRKINEVDAANANFEPILKQLAKVTGVQDLDLCIMTAQGQGPYEHLITTDKAIPQKCLQHDCYDCVQHHEDVPQSGKKLKYQLNHSENNYGVLVVYPDDESQLEDWQHQLFKSVAEQIANGLSLKHKSEQGRRITLMNERTVIARELHDSLAQALSYLKIQVTRLQKLQKKEDVQDQVEEVIDELKNGLSSAYRELRELLTTFRLKLDNRSLKEAFEQSITQLKSRSDAFQFTLDYQVDHIPFAPQEEIHLLQIAREAIQNAFYHSKGNKIDISIVMDQQSLVTLTVQDNGIGIPGDPNKLNHYGLAIMQERSRNLNGEVIITKPDQGGTMVSFQFIPEYAKVPAVQNG